MKRNVNKITEAILKGKDIRKSLSLSEAIASTKEEAKEIYKEICKGVERVNKILAKDKTPITIEDGPCLSDETWEGTFSDIEVSVSEYDYTFMDGEPVEATVYFNFPDSANNKISNLGLELAFEKIEDKLLKIVKKEIRYPISEMDSCDGWISVSYDLLDMFDEDLDESLKESVTPDSKDIARAEKLKTQDPKFAEKMSKSITDPVKWERRYQAIKDVCGEDSEQAKAFNKAHELKNNSETGQLFRQIAEWFKKDFKDHAYKYHDVIISDLEILNSSTKLALSYYLEDLHSEWEDDRTVKTTLSISDVEFAIGEYNDLYPQETLDLASLLEKCKDEDVYEEFSELLFDLVPLEDH